jgi:hypothetical protein
MLNTDEDQYADGAAALIGHIVEDKVASAFAEVTSVDGEVLHVVGLSSRKLWDTTVGNVEPVSARRELRLRVSMANQRSTGTGSC